MFKQPYIDETHRIALEAALKGRTTLTQALLAKLYKHALEAATAATSRENGFFHSRIETPDYTVGTCTDVKTGVYVQLVKQKTNPHLLLTLGQKFAMENVDTVRGNINTLFWQP
jgi:hypothetical protein